MSTVVFCFTLLAQWVAQQVSVFLYYLLENSLMQIQWYYFTAKHSVDLLNSFWLLWSLSDFDFFVKNGILIELLITFRLQQFVCVQLTLSINCLRFLHHLLFFLFKQLVNGWFNKKIKIMKWNDVFKSVPLKENKKVKRMGQISDFKNLCTNSSFSWITLSYGESEFFSHPFLYRRLPL